MPLEIRVSNNRRVTDARVPSERAIASSRTSIAWAELSAKRVGISPNFFANAAANRFPAAPSRSPMGPGWLISKPSALAPFSTAVSVSKPSATNWTLGPRRARRSRRSWTAPGANPPVMKTPSVPVRATRAASWA